MNLQEFIFTFKDELFYSIGAVVSFIVGWFVKGRRDMKISDIDIKKKEQDYTIEYVHFTEDLVQKLENMQKKILLLQSTITEVKKENLNLKLELEVVKDKLYKTRSENKDLKIELDEHQGKH